jgi:chemotaxis methyl-accepting protein methylase
MELADLGGASISPLPVPRNRPGGNEGIAKRPDLPANGEARFLHVLFRGTSPIRSEAKKPVTASRPALPPASPRPDTGPDAATLFLRRILMQAGLNPLLYRTPPLLRRLPACLRALRAENCAAAERVLAAKPELISHALESLLIGTTELFRDPPVFTQLEDDVLPQLLRRPSRPRIWSAGCSEGAELYSVAILLAKLGGLDGSRLLGSDCRRDAIERAKRGVYQPGDREFPATASRHWQLRADGRITISHAIREALQWEQADLLSPRESGTWDLILCRNLAIYLEPLATELLWNRLTEALAPGGFLIVGRAETPRLSCLRRIAPSIYSKCTSFPTS